LAAIFLGLVPTTPVVPNGHHAGHREIPFPPGDRITHRRLSAKYLIFLNKE
jgi:hypothetical protein